MPTPTLTPPPPAASTLDPSTFDTKMDARIAWDSTHVSEETALVAWVNSMATTVASDASSASSSAATATAQAATATTKAAEAVAAAAAAVNAPGTACTSTTSISLTAGTKTFTTQAGKSIPDGGSIKFVCASDVSKWAVGTVVSYNSGTGQLVLSVDANDINGSGTFADWQLSVSGHRGAPGAAAVAPGLVLIGTPVSASNVAYVDFTGLDTTYDEYELHFHSVTPMSSARFYVRTSKDNGANYLTTGYSTTGVSIDAGTVQQTGSGVTDKAVVFEMQTILPFGSNPSAGINGVLRIYRPASSRYVAMGVDVNADRSGAPYFSKTTSLSNMGSGFVCNALRLFFDSANIEAGLFKLYGVRKS